MMKDASKKRRDGLIFTVWTLDGKSFIKRSPTGEAFRVFSLEDVAKP